METVSSSGMLGALGSRDFRLLWAGQTVSLIGNAALLVAVGWRSVELTSRAGALGLILAAQAAAMLTTLLIGGVLADRYERRRLMILSDLARAAVVAVLAAANASGHLSFATLLVLATLVGLGDGLFHPAFGGIVPLVVESPMLPSANALIGISRQGSFLVGPALAALLYEPLGPTVVFAFDAFSFLVSAALLWLARPRPIEPEPRAGAFREIAAGARYVAGIPWLWVTIGIAALVLMLQVAPFQALLPGLVEDHFHRGSGGYGLLTALLGVGMLIGSLAYGHLRPRRGRARATYLLWALNDLLVIGVVATPWFWLAGVLQAVRGAAVGFGITAWETMLMELVPENRLSRVISLDFFGSLGLMPVGYALAAGVAGFTSPATIIAVGAAASCATWLLGLSRRDVRGVG